MSQPSRRRLRIETNGETGRVGDDCVSQWVNKTYVKEAVTESRSEVDKVTFCDRNLMGVVTHKCGPVSGMKSLGRLSLCDPNFPPVLIRDGYNKETTSSETVTNRNGAGVVPVIDNADGTSTATGVESHVDINLSIENIMEETSIPILLPPLGSEPETDRSHGQSMYYLTCIYVYIIPVV